MKVIYHPKLNMLEVVGAVTWLEKNLILPKWLNAGWVVIGDF